MAGPGGPQVSVRGPCILPQEIHGRGLGRTVTELFKIKFSLVQIKGLGPVLGGDENIMDSFYISIPEHVWGVRSSKSEAPYLVAQAFFERMRKRLGK